MSFQAYLDALENKTGKTPRELLAEAQGKGFDRLTKATIQETERHHELVGGPTVAELAAQRGVHPMDLMVDLALEDGLATRYRIVLANDDDYDRNDRYDDRVSEVELDLLTLLEGA